MKLAGHSREEQTPSFEVKTNEHDKPIRHPQGTLPGRARAAS